MASIDDEEHMLTTVDNPYSPFTHYDEWDAWDRAAGYNSASMLARIAKSSPELSAADQDQAVEDAIDEIVTLNVNGRFTKAVRPAA